MCETGVVAISKNGQMRTNDFSKFCPLKDVEHSNKSVQLCDNLLLSLGYCKCKMSTIEFQ